MPAEIAKLTRTIQEELGLLRELAGDLMACRQAFTGMDLDSIYTHVAKQATLCEKLQVVGQERAAAWKAEFAGRSHPANETDLRVWLASLDPEIGRHMRELLTELALAEGEVRNLNHVHTLFLNGSRRTLNVLANALAAFSPTYAPPQATKALTGTAVGTRP
jgi:hypothetical protein